MFFSVPPPIIGLKAVYLCGENKGNLPDIQQAQFIFLTPEQAINQATKKVLQARRDSLKLLVIDEAHCVMESDETFRPDYKKLGTLQTALRAPVMGLTATPTQAVRSQVPTLVGVTHYTLVEASLDRPELFMEFRLVDGLVHLDHELLEEFRALKDLALVFCTSKADACSLYEEAKAVMGKSVGVFHASLSEDQKKLVMGRLMTQELRVAFCHGLSRYGGSTSLDSTG